MIRWSLVASQEKKKKKKEEEKKKIANCELRDSDELLYRAAAT